jgi:hypothetical protein
MSSNIQVALGAYKLTPQHVGASQTQVVLQCLDRNSPPDVKRFAWVPVSHDAMSGSWKAGDAMLLSKPDNGDTVVLVDHRLTLQWSLFPKGDGVALLPLAVKVDKAMWYRRYVYFSLATLGAAEAAVVQHGHVVDYRQVVRRAFEPENCHLLRRLVVERPKP